MLTPDKYPNKMLTPGHVPPDAQRGTCPACHATGLVVVRHETDGTGTMRLVVFGCRCPHPPLPIAEAR